MFSLILHKIFGSKNIRDLKKLSPVIDEINRCDKEYQSLSDDEIRAKTADFRERIKKEIEDNNLQPKIGELKDRLSSTFDQKDKKELKSRINGIYRSVLDPILPEAYAAVKNVCRRLLGRKFNVCGHEIEWDMVPFDVQLLGAIVLHQGKIAEMATGEGKTLVATMPLYLNALFGKNVHLVTVNDYLARRDSEWMGKIYEFLGLTVGCIQNGMTPDEKKVQYQRDITYGTNSEFGFDYLRDNGLATSADDIVQRGYFFAIIDEVDSILVDEARTPLIISGPSSVSTHKYDSLRPKVEQLYQTQSMLCNRLMKEVKDSMAAGETDLMNTGLKLFKVSRGSPKNRQFLKMMEKAEIRKLLERTDLELRSDLKKEAEIRVLEDLFFNIDEKGHDIKLTEKGRLELSAGGEDEYIIPDIITKCQEIDEDSSMDEKTKAGLKAKIERHYEEISEKIHNINQLLRAYSLFEKDVDYIVMDNKVVIVDEFTGRMMPGRRFSDGLHQALEAKEKVKIERETQTYATITIQNYFRLYDKLAGMTGTAETEAEEFNHIYGLDVTVVPTNKPCARKDDNDVIYRTKREKYAAIIEEIARLNKEENRPVLVGTISVEVSELLSRMLKRRNVPHEVLNAKYHQKEAEIIKRAGMPGAVTIATNMAGRGTDIKLGKGIAEKGGLAVLGTERHESRRIDRQLRGRCARQGDPGSSQFFASLEDDLMRLFGSDRISSILQKMGMEEGQELAHPLLNRSIENAQRRVEQRNFDIRKHTLEFDDVLNKQREVIYENRMQILFSQDPEKYYLSIVYDLIREKTAEYCQLYNELSEPSPYEFIRWVNNILPVNLEAQPIMGAGNDPDAIADIIDDRVKRVLELKKEIEGEKEVSVLIKFVMLNTIDNMWKSHLYNMDDLRHGIHMRAYAATGENFVLGEYSKEAYAMFSEMMANINQRIAASLFRTTMQPGKMDEFIKNLPRSYKHEEIKSFNLNPPSSGNESSEPAGASGNPNIMNKAATVRREGIKVGRNDPCPCGSGKKYKKCCGANSL
ncbi:preprotein translocase subunit SecA [bacterium]|jgi:preprotein translocase subunit SecA|nr:preprotein translocase subunit SecA [bacterium]